MSNMSTGATELLESMFLNRRCFVVFCLVKLDSIQRCDFLNISESLYGNKIEAKKWYDDLMATLGDESMPVPEIDANEAKVKLEDIYRRMTRSN